MCKLEDYKILKQTAELNVTLGELDKWHEEYLPLKEGTVLDVGADEGATALFYAMHGAKAVIAIEGDAKHYKILEANAKVIEQKYGTRVIPLGEMLGNIKIDIEGAEEGLVMEYHFPHYWRVLRRPNRHCAVQRLERRKYISNKLHMGYVRDKA